jgi:hypothetical protein
MGRGIKMKNVFSMDCKSRMIVCALFAFLAFLLIGAGKVTDELRKRIADRKSESSQWNCLTEEIQRELPLEHRAQWRQCTAENPALFLRVNTVKFERLREESM